MPIQVSYKLNPQSSVFCQGFRPIINFFKTIQTLQSKYNKQFSLVAICGRSDFCWTKKTIQTSKIRRNRTNILKLYLNLSAKLVNCYTEAIPNYL